jgi:hypothetical protein
MKTATNVSSTAKRPKGTNKTKEDTRNVKEIMTGLVAKLPPDCTWDDVMYKVYVCQKIAAGLRDEEEGRVFTEEEIFRDLGL